MASEWWSEHDDIDLLAATYDSLAELPGWASDRLEAYEAMDAMKLELNSGRNSTNSFTAMSCEASEDILQEKDSQNLTFLQKVPETYHRSVGECHHAPQQETTTSFCSLRPRLLFRLKGVLRAFFY